MDHSIYVIHLLLDSIFSLCATLLSSLVCSRFVKKSKVWCKITVNNWSKYSCWKVAVCLLLSLSQEILERHVGQPSPSPAWKQQMMEYIWKNGVHHSSRVADTWLQHFQLLFPSVCHLSLPFILDDSREQICINIILHFEWVFSLRWGYTKAYLLHFWHLSHWCRHTTWHSESGSPAGVGVVLHEGNFELWAWTRFVSYHGTLQNELSQVYQLQERAPGNRGQGGKRQKNPDSLPEQRGREVT